MNDNLPWLFGAFALGFTILFAYLFWISGRERSLRRRIAALQQVLEQPNESRK